MQIAFVVWPQMSNPFFIWKNDHTSHTWLSISLMLHLILSACLLMGEYVFVYYTIGVFDKYYKKYEIDVESLKLEKSQLVIKYADNQKEYALLINDKDEEEV